MGQVRFRLAPAYLISMVDHACILDRKTFLAMWKAQKIDLWSNPGDMSLEPRQAGKTGRR
jgi:hypothetical protein